MAREGWVDLSRLLDLERGGWLRRRNYGAYVVWDYTQKTHERVSAIRRRPS